jgi:glycosyltransferase involved in cell wall biosynthesis
LVGRAENWFLRSVDHVVVIHDRFAELVRDAGVPAHRVSVIRNWSHVEQTARPSDSQRAAARARFGWPPNETVVLHAGNQGVKQGLSNVVDAARRADDSGAPVRFVLLGDGNSRRDLERAARGVNRLQFIDPLPDDEFQLALGAADVLLVNELPNLREMCVPSKLTTYFATGRPVLAATDRLSLTAREIELSSAGVCVPAGAPDALLEAALLLGRDAQLSESLGSAGLKYRSSVLSMPHAIEAWEAVLELVSGRSGE